MDLAAPVDVGGLGQEAVDHARGIGRPVIGLFFHLFLDGLAQLDAGLGGLFHAALLIGLRHKGRHRGGFAGSWVLGHENNQAIAGASENALARVGRKYLVDDVHRGAAGHGDARAHLHDVPGRDRPGEVDMAHVCGHAVLAGPLHGAGIGGLINPFQDAAAANAGGAGHGDVGWRCHKA